MRFLLLLRLNQHLNIRQMSLRESCLKLPCRALKPPSPSLHHNQSRQLFVKGECRPIKSQREFIAPFSLPVASDLNAFELSTLNVSCPNSETESDSGICTGVYNRLLTAMRLLRVPQQTMNFSASYLRGLQILPSLLLIMLIRVWTITSPHRTNSIISCLKILSSCLLVCAHWNSSYSSRWYTLKLW